MGHSYHLVDPSPWPISGSLGALATTVGGVMYMHSIFLLVHRMDSLVQVG